jgi:hypothetical protein
MIQSGKEYILEIFIRQFENCYDPDYFPKRGRSGYIKHCCLIHVTLITASKNAIRTVWKVKLQE